MKLVLLSVMFLSTGCLTRISIEDGCGYERKAEQSIADIPAQTVPDIEESIHLEDAPVEKV